MDLLAGMQTSPCLGCPHYAYNRCTDTFGPGRGGGGGGDLLAQKNICNAKNVNVEIRMQMLSNCMKYKNVHSFNI